MSFANTSFKVWETELLVALIARNAGADAHLRAQLPKAA